MVRASRIFEFLLVAFLVTGGSLCAQTSSDMETDMETADVWVKAPTREKLIERFKQRDAAFGDYLIEFDVTKSEQRNPLAEWHSNNWKKPRKPPKDLEPPYLETQTQRCQFATHAEEEHLDWRISEVRKDGVKDEDNYHVGHCSRTSTWKEVVRTEYYTDREDRKPLFKDSRGPEIHKNNPTVPPTILDLSLIHI